LFWILRKYVLSIISILFVLRINAQSHLDTIHLQEVIVKGYNLSQFSIGNKIETIDKDILEAYHHTNLGDLFLNTTLLNNSSYMNLTSISMRGSGTSHTAVLWNGFNIQNSLNGGVNMAYIPASFMDDVKIQYGGSSALYGSGAIGGTIHLNSQLEYNTGFSSEINTSAGSFGLYDISGKILFSNNTYTGALRFTDHMIQNNYTFTNTFNFKPKIDTMVNADNHGSGIVSDNLYKINNRQQLVSHIWIQQNRSGDPDPISTSPTHGRETSTESRATLEWQYFGDKNDFYVRTAWFNEHLLYHSLVDSGNHRAITYITEAEGRSKINQLQNIRYGTNFTFEEGISDDFSGGNHFRRRNAFYASYNILSSSHKNSYIINVREELVNSVTTPVTFSTGLNCFLTDSLTLKGNLSKNYRIPDFDDLYWNVWGNPDLKPESGYSSDVGYSYVFKLQQVKIKIDQTIYAGIISNWIIWEPSPSNPSIWHPYNLNKVFSRGVENNIRATYILNDFKLGIGASYNLTIATQMNAANVDPSLVGKELIYVPKNKAGCSFNIGYKTFSAEFIQVYTGLRYSDDLNTPSQEVNSFTIGNLILSDSFSYKKLTVKFNFYLNNLWNSDYQVIQWYPMPRRNFMAGITFRFN